MKRKTETNLVALSVRQPWAYLLSIGVKDIENRTWRTNYRGRLLIHAGARPVDRETFELARRLARRAGVDLPADLPRGGIVGEVQLLDCVEKSRSRWFSGPIGWVLEGGRQRRFKPLKGALGIFRVDRKALK